MPMRTMSRPLLAVPCTVALLALTACSGSESEGGSGEASSGASPSSSGSAEASSEQASSPVAPLTFVNDPSAQPSDGPSESPSASASASADDQSSEPTCYAIGKDDPAEVAWFGSAVNVTASGKLVDVRALNSPGVSLNVEDTQQVPLAGKVDSVGGIGDWPLTEEQVNRFVVVRNASDLYQVDLRANQTVLPVLHLTVQPDSSVGEFVFTYEIANGQRSEVTYPADLEFAKSCGKG